MDIHGIPAARLRTLEHDETCARIVLDDQLLTQFTQSTQWTGVSGRGGGLGRRDSFGSNGWRHSSLGDLATFIDRACVDLGFAGISNAAKGGSDWPPLALLKALRHGSRLDLSEMWLAEALTSRNSLRHDGYRAET